MPLLSTLKYSTTKSAGASADGAKLSAFRTSVEEGDEVTFLLNKAEPGIDVPYTITGITADDLFFGSLTGNFTVNAAGDGQLTVILSRTDGDWGDEIMKMTLDGTDVYIDVTILNTTPIVGEVVYDIPGTYSWTCPDGVTSVCVVAIGGGGGASGGSGSHSGGGGGGLGFTNNISVTPGQTYPVVVGVAGNGRGFSWTIQTYASSSHFISSSLYVGAGGGNGRLSTSSSSSTPSGNGGYFNGQGGGSGGAGGGIGTGYSGPNGAVSGGGGGAGGYNSTGGAGGPWFTSTGTAGFASSGNRSGGGGGGARQSNSFPGYGGGSSLYGSATTSGGAGAGGGVNSFGGLSGWDTRYSQLSQWSLDAGNYRDNSGNYLTTAGRYSKYGGAAGGGYNGGEDYTTQFRGGHGAVRIMWGTGRSFPDNADYVAPSSGVNANLIQTLSNPNPYGTSAGDRFGSAAYISGHYAIIGAYGEDESSGSNSGKAYIFNVTTGALVHTLNNPNAYGTSANDLLGLALSIDGNYAITGVKGEDDAGGLDSGKAYIFNVTTGALVHTLSNPNPYGTSSNDVFGQAVGISGNYAIVGSAEDDSGGQNAGKAYIFNVTTGALVHTLNNPNAYGTSSGDTFGGKLAIGNGYAAISANTESDAGGGGSGKAYIFDVTTGALVHTLVNPNAYGTSTSDNFGQAIAMSGNYVIVGAFQEDDAGGTTSGKAYIFNVTTGALVHTLNNPNAYGTSDQDWFATSVAISGNYAIAGSLFEDDAGGTQSGKAYIFNVTTGALLLTLDNPNAYGTSASDQFGQQVSMSGNYAIVTASAEDDAGGTESGKAYIYKLSPT